MSRRWATSRDSLTMLYKDVLANTTYHDSIYDFLESLDGFTSDDVDGIFEAIASKYALCDINIPTKGINQEYTAAEVNVFLQDMFYILNLKRPYYVELIHNYQKEYDYATGNKRTTHREDSWNKQGSTTNTVTSSGEHTEYELPNKVVGDNYKATPNAIDSDTGSSTNQGNNATITTGSSDTVVTYSNEFLDLKRKYLSQLRNVYEEYADELKECFYLIYYTNLVKEEA